MPSCGTKSKPHPNHPILTHPSSTLLEEHPQCCQKRLGHQKHRGLVKITRINWTLRLFMLRFPVVSRDFDKPAAFLAALKSARFFYCSFFLTFSPFFAVKTTVFSPFISGSGNLPV
jgi:hypothetical protein